MTNQELARKAWYIFAQYIKHRDVVGEDHGGYFGFCCTCNEKTYLGWAAHAGHCFSRADHTLKFAENNNHLQCHKCNMMGKGEEELYKEFISKTYGELVLETLEKINESSKGTYNNLDSVYHQGIIDEYKQKLIDRKAALKVNFGPTYNIDDLRYL